MTNQERGGDTQEVMTIEVASKKEAKKLFSKLDKKVNGLVFSSDESYVYRNTLPRFSAVYKKADGHEIVENCVEISYDLAGFDSPRASKKLK